jgi:hypothetical protein
LGTKLNRYKPTVAVTESSADEQSSKGQFCFCANSFADHRLATQFPNDTDNYVFGKADLVVGYCGPQRRETHLHQVHQSTSVRKCRGRHERAEQSAARPRLCRVDYGATANRLWTRASAAPNPRMFSSVGAIGSEPQLSFIGVFDPDAVGDGLSEVAGAGMMSRRCAD